MVGNTSVRIRIAPENTRIGPNSPSARAHARRNADNIPRRTCGSTTWRNACPRLQPTVNATCSWRTSICWKVTIIVRTAKAQATANWARTIDGFWYVIGTTDSIARPIGVENKINKLRPITIGGSTIGMSSTASSNARPRNENRVMT